MAFWSVKEVDNTIEAVREGRLGVEIHAYGAFRPFSQEGAEEFLAHFREEVERGRQPDWNPEGFWTEGGRSTPYFRILYLRGLAP